ncbi:MAG: XRE family transcriptional regulator [Pedobacter sp.]|nr:MAG: XRE family transcriptional regulator [Pedobacter sp.]
MNDFGQRVRKRREELGINQDVFAQKISVKSGKQTISKWEMGRSFPDLSEIYRIAEALGVSVCWLVDGSVENEAPTMKEPPAGYVLVPAQQIIEMQQKIIDLMQGRPA